MLSGSPKTYYHRPKKPAGEDELKYAQKKSELEVDTSTNDNAEKAHHDMMAAIIGSNIHDHLPSNLHFMLAASMNLSARAFRKGDFKDLGQMPADGLKRNNAVMQDQKQFTSEFYLCAKMTADVLNIMERSELSP